MNLALTGLGAAAFGGLLLLLLLAPAAFDRMATDVAISEVSDRLDASLAEAGGGPGAGGPLSGKAMEHLPPALRDRLSSLDRLRAPETDTETLVRGVLAAACKLECRVPGAVPPDLSPLFAGLRADLAAAQERLREVVLRHYDRVLEEVRQDVTVFAATNLALMLAAFLLALLKGRASVHLLPASLLLSLVTLLMGSWYLVGQDWLLAAVFSDYWGYSYSVLAGLLAGSLLDIAFLQARITTFLLNLLLGLVGAATSIVPC